jgi:CheY-like chemotaxis protein
MRILLIDHDPASVAALREALAALSTAEIQEAATGTDALIMLNGFNDGFDLAFLDLSVPDMDGVDLIRRIRQRPALQAMPLIVCTGMADRATVARVAALGIRHYVVKPFVPEVVLTKVADAIALRTVPLAR